MNGRRRTYISRKLHIKNCSVSHITPLNTDEEVDVKDEEELKEIISFEDLMKKKYYTQSLRSRL